MNKIKILTLTDKELDKKIKLKGTEHDRKRKVTDKMAKEIAKKFRKGYSVQELVDQYGFCRHTILYWANPDYREHYKATTCGRHYGKFQTLEDRAAYKRQLVAAGKVKV